MLKRLTSGVLVIVLLICMLPQLHFETHAAYYPEGWETWGQWEEPWGSMIMSPGLDTIGRSGCVMSSYAKAYIQAGLITDDDTSFDLGTFTSYCTKNGVFNERSWIINYDAILSYPDGKPKMKYVTDPANTNLEDGDIMCHSVAGWSKEEIVARLSDLRNQGKIVLLRVCNRGHTVLVGDPFINDDGVADIKLHDTGWSSGCGAIMSDNYRIGSIAYYTVLERVDGKPVYPGDIFIDTKAEAVIDSAVQESAEANSPLYRISNYNEEQKESLALLQNKAMDNYELAAWKWNMIVSQFSIPYRTALSDVLSSKNWGTIYRSIQSAEYEENPYLKAGTIDVNENFQDGAKEYLEYLKTNSSKLNEVLRLLANESENVYTPLWNAEKTSATVSDLLYGDVLYIRDNVTVTGDALTVKEEDSENNDVVFEISNTLEETDTTVSQPLSLWESLEKMYDISTGDARQAYKSILEQSAVQTITMPVFTATDATALYNTLFISNAMELNGGYTNAMTTDTFVDEYLEKLLYMDRWGNICINQGSKYVIVYPSYANPLFVSTELEGTDLAGVYYETLSEQLKKYNLTIEGAKGDKTSSFLMSLDNKVQITVDEAIEHIKNHGTATLDSTVGDDGSFKVSTALGGDNIDTSTKQYNRLANAVNLSDSSPPLYRLDTTTVAFANKTLLTMMTRDSGTHSTRNWYTELSKPSYKTNSSTLEILGDLVSPASSAGKLTVERFDTRVGLQVTRPSATNSFVSASGEHFSLVNGHNIATLSKWKVNGDVIEPYFEEETKTVDDSGAVIGYSTGVDLLVSPADYPFMNYFNGVKDIFNTDYNTGQLRPGVTTLLSGNSLGEVSYTYRKLSTYDVDTDAKFTDIIMYENLYALEYLDSERFNLYFTTNTDLDTTGTGTKKYTRATANTYVDDITNNALNKGVDKPDTQTDVTRRRLLSIPLLATTVDDTSSWGIWNGQSGNIDRYRDVDTSLVINRGILQANAQDTLDIVGGFDYTTSGLKYLLTNEVVSNVLLDPPIEDIISIAYMWDTYYIPNSPICTKLDVKDLKIGTSIYKENTVLTPYNAIHENNNNELFWTRETNGSINMSIETVGNSLALKSSKYSVYREIYQVDINYPIFVLAINKNGYGANLDKWVEDLQDPASTSSYIMDLIGAFIKHPITGIKNLTLTLLQLLHTAIATESIGGIFGINIIFDFIWGSQGAFYFLVAYVAFMCVGMVVIGLRSIFNKDKQNVLKAWGRVLIVGLIPIILITQLAPLFSWLTNNTLSPVINKIILTELEGAQRGQSKIQLGGDDSIMLENLVYNQETFADLTVSMLVDFDQYDRPIYTEVNLADLYQSVSYNEWLGQAEYLMLEKDFTGLDKTISEVWYNTEEFVPVHYSKYSSSVFYYFYDWIKSTYIRYYAAKDSDMLNGYKRPSTGEQLAYVTNVRSAEEMLLKSADGMFKMFNDDAYIRVDSGYSDMFGLSNLFKMTDNYGLPVKTYSSDISIETWAQSECDKTLDRLLNFEMYKQDAKNAVLASPISGIVLSPYWKQYSDSPLLEGKDMGNMMAYNFTPDYLQDVHNHSISMDFTNGWQTKGYLLPSDNNGRIPWRVYGSEALLKRDVGIISEKTGMPTNLESALFQMNQNIYSQVLNLCEVYEDSHISDDTMIFTFALLATFEFNSVFGEDTTSLNLDTVSTDKLFRVIYATQIEDVIDNPNLVFMVYKSGGILTALVFTITELVFVITMFVRNLIYAILLLACMVICLTSFNLKEIKVISALKGILIQLAVLLAGQLILIAVLRIGLNTISTIDGKGMLFMVTLLYGIVCFSLCKWHLAMFKSLLKSLKTFGYGVMHEELAGLSSVINTASTQLKRIRVDKVSGIGVRLSNTVLDHSSERRLASMRRRLSNSQKLTRRTVQDIDTGKVSDIDDIETDEPNLFD